MSLHASQGISLIGSIVRQSKIETEFDPARWDHWLLLFCFGAIALWGLWLSWQWDKEDRATQARGKMARRLMRELHQVSSEEYVPTSSQTKSQATSRVKSQNNRKSA